MIGNGQELTYAYKERSLERHAILSSKRQFLFFLQGYNFCLVNKYHSSVSLKVNVALYIIFIIIRRQWLVESLICTIVHETIHAVCFCPACAFRVRFTDKLILFSPVRGRSILARLSQVKMFYVLTKTMVLEQY